MVVKKILALVVIIPVFLVACLLVLMAGCEKDPLDPTQIGRFRATPTVNVILSSLGVADEDPDKFYDAQEPLPVDLLELDQDYVLNQGDFIDLSIFELLAEKTPYEQTFEISESGVISIPEIGQVQAAGLTEIQLEEELKQILSPTLIKNPSVSVRLRQSQSRAYTILGEGVPQPGRYLLPGYTYRLADALAQAGSPRQFNVSYIYITRYEKRQPEYYQAPTPSYSTEPAIPEKIDLMPKEPSGIDKEKELLEIIAPHTSKAKTSKGNVVITAAEAATYRELKSLAAPDDLMLDTDIDDDFANQAQAQNIEAPAPIEEKQTRIEWIFQDGKWVAVEVEVDNRSEPADIAQERPQSQVAQQPQQQLGQDLPDIGTDTDVRVIKIPVKKLGIDPKYNVVIRPNDTINVPFNVIGEAVVMGNVNRQGYIDITGRPMTLMQAIAAAGGLGPLAEPSRVEVRRRIGENREQIVSVDLDKIAKGLQPDFFIKQDDTINVGTLPSSRFAAVLRNAFRATYGFGFIYDRNFADRDFGTSRPIPNWF